MEDGGGAQAQPGISMASSEGTAVDLDLLEQLLSGDNGWLEVEINASPSTFLSDATASTTALPPRSANNSTMWIQSSTFRQRIDQALAYIRETQRDADVLVQLWLPVKGNDGQLLLSTSGQPFSLDKRSESLRRFRDMSTHYTFSADVASLVAVGLPGRVFFGKIPEWSPDVWYFTRYEYPQVSHAQTLGVHGTMGLPVFEQGNYACLGVMELVMTRQKLNFTSEFNNICSALQAVDLRSTEVSSIPRTKLTSASYRDALPEILEVLRVVCITHRLPLAQTWVACSQQGKRGSRHSDENYTYCISTIDAACYVNDPRMQNFQDACSDHHLLCGQGVAGKAFTTNQLCFLPDIGSSTKLEYPLSHHAKIFNLKGALAIRLRCTRTGTANFVLEFFLPTDCEAFEEQKAVLDSLLGTMGSACQTLRVVTHKDMEDEAMLDMNELNSFPLCVVTNKEMEDEAMLEMNELNWFAPHVKNRVEELSFGDKAKEHREEASWTSLDISPLLNPSPPPPSAPRFSPDIPSLQPPHPPLTGSVSGLGSGLVASSRECCYSIRSLASNGAADACGELQAVDVDNTSGGAGQLQAPKAVQKSDGKVKAPQALKEDENKDARKKRGSRSEMWNHFKKIVIDGVLQKGKCNYCNTDIAAHTIINGTSALHKHFNFCKRNPNKRVGDDKPSVLEVHNGDSVHDWNFDPEALRNSFVAMIIEDELPFAFGEKSGFKKFMAVACPSFSVPSRRTCTRDTIRIYFEERAKLKLFFKEQCERVCLRTDYWTSKQQESFMTVSAHFICNDWKLHKKIISFRKVKGHKGEDVGKHLQKTLIDWGLEKVMTITVDNASSNDGGILYMKKELEKSNNSIAGANHVHMRCAADIVNLIVADGLKEIEISVKRVCAAVRYVHNIPDRITKFKECAEVENVCTKAFLNLDVKTRWNSTYYILKDVVGYEKMFSRYSNEEPYFALDLLSEKVEEKCIGVPDENDWENVRKMENFLRPFADLTTRISSSLHVTGSNLFHEIGEVNLLVKTCMDSDDVLQKAMGHRMKTKFDKYWGNWHEPDPSKKGEEKENINLMIFILAVLDPRYKLSEYTQFAILEIYGDDKGPKVWDAVKNCIRDLFEEYKVMYARNVASVHASFSLGVEPSEGSASMMKSLIAKKMRLNNGGGSSRNKSELDKFLAEEIEDDAPNLDILAWWKFNSSRFPILACLARDVFAIPISTVALEYAFSTGGLVLDDFRTSLTPFMVEALVCTQDWLRHTNPINIVENTEELTNLEKDLVAEYKDMEANNQV